MSTELSSIDFRSMIGGPLTAVVKSQSDAALTTVEFIRSVGFTEDGEPVMVHFKYDKPDPSGGNPQTYTLSVPFLSLVPIPYLRVEETTIAFKAKINSIATTEIETEFGIDGSLELRQEWNKGSVELKVSASYQKNTTSGTEVNKTYSLDVSVRAVQDELPAGTERVLNILEEAILAVPE